MGRAATPRAATRSTRGPRRPGRRRLSPARTPLNPPGGPPGAPPPEATQAGAPAAEDDQAGAHQSGVEHHEQPVGGAGGPVVDDRPGVRPTELRQGLVEWRPSTRDAEG